MPSTRSSGNGAPERTWLVDPLCGTLNFAAQTPLLAVNVALQTGVLVDVAACADPMAAELFWTDGTAAYGRRGGGPDGVLRTSQTGTCAGTFTSPLVLPCVELLAAWSAG